MQTQEQRAVLDQTNEDLRSSNEKLKEADGQLEVLRKSRGKIGLELEQCNGRLREVLDQLHEVEKELKNAKVCCMYVYVYVCVCLHIYISQSVICMYIKCVCICICMYVF